MKLKDAISTFQDWDQKGKYVFTKHDLRKLFPEDSPKAFSESLNRLVKNNILVRAYRGVYVFEKSRSIDSYTIERIAKALRRGKYNYVSLESMLSEYGIISQVPIDRLSVMTTGRSGTCKTPFGVIEFTHTKRSVKDILNSTLTVGKRPLRIARKEAALRDLRRIGRNLDLVKLKGKS